MDAQQRRLMERFRRNVFDTDRMNTRTRERIDTQNRAVDLQASQALYEQALRERQGHYQAALRYISGGKFDLARAHLDAAGLNPDGSSKKNSGSESSPSQGRVPSEPESTAVENTDSSPSGSGPQPPEASPPPGSKVSPTDSASPTPAKPEQKTPAENSADLQVLDQVLSSVEKSLAEDPDEATRQELLNRWKSATRHYLQKNPDVDDSSVDFWTERLFEDLKKELGDGRLTKRSDSANQENSPQNRWDSGFIGLLNRMVKIGSQPIIGYDNLKQFEGLIGAEPGTAPTWSELREARKQNQKETLKEYLAQPPAGSVSDPEGVREAMEELQTVREEQKSIQDILSEDQQTDSRPFTENAWDLRERWTDLEKKANELRGVIEDSQNDGSDTSQTTDWDLATDPTVQRGQQQANRFYQQSLLTNLVGATPENTEQIMNQLYELGQQNGQTSQQVDVRVNEQLVKNIRSASDEGERERIIKTLVENWRRQGFSGPQIERGKELLFPTPRRSGRGSSIRGQGEIQDIKNKGTV